LPRCATAEHGTEATTNEAATTNAKPARPHDPRPMCRGYASRALVEKETSRIASGPGAL
jgi:hypothetical protein